MKTTWLVTSDVHQPDILNEGDADHYVDLTACSLMFSRSCLSITVTVLVHSWIDHVHLLQFQIVLETFQDHYIACLLQFFFTSSVLLHSSFFYDTSCAFTAVLKAFQDHFSVILYKYEFCIENIMLERHFSIIRLELHYVQYFKDHLLFR